MMRSSFLIAENHPQVRLFNFGAEAATVTKISYTVHLLNL